MQGAVKETNNYLLLDLERTIANGLPYYWKLNKHGYTPHVAKAGLFSQEIADKICEMDLDQTTIKIEKEVVIRLLSRGNRQHEGKV